MIQKSISICWLHGYKIKKAKVIDQKGKAPEQHPDYEDEEE